MYMYGSKKIFAKIMNDKLVIRLNGGFMLIEEFLKNFSEGESKLQLLQDQVWTPLGVQDRKSPFRKSGSPKLTRGGSPKK